jgi:DNA-directed RNA polymerase sigma subunit (sigma70/sigma32)
VKADEKARYARHLQTEADDTPNMYLSARELNCCALRLSGATFKEIAVEMELPSAMRARQIVAKAARKMRLAYEAMLSQHDD